MLLVYLGLSNNCLYALPLGVTRSSTIEPRRDSSQDQLE